MRNIRSSSFEFGVEPEYGKMFKEELKSNQTLHVNDDGHKGSGDTAIDNCSGTTRSSQGWGIPQQKKVYAIRLCKLHCKYFNAVLCDSVRPFCIASSVTKLQARLVNGVWSVPGYQMPHPSSAV